ncbi:glycosyltransferase family 2 protein [Nocardioides sp. Kera G14]|uniref:glycosyltransferase family 2 protein n=1 Tax=Nocardioides sp. Kera G14 TaxID=2884264 RepID=UPI0022392347|nr:glycosyltransferase family 2 protein [Nocardioides sp. Kera G14]
MSVVVPALNEAMNVHFVLRQLPTVHEVILVDGGSVDGTVSAARQACQHLTVIRRLGAGKGAALAAGVTSATGDVIVTLPVDGTVDPSTIPALVGELVAGAGFVAGSRRLSGGGSAEMTALRALGDRLVNLLANRLYGSGTTDIGFGFYGFWADRRDVLDLPVASQGRWADGDQIDVLLTARAARAGLTVAEVPVVERFRIFGEQPRTGLRDLVNALRALWSERRRPVSVAQSIEVHPAHALQMLERALAS